MAPMLSLELSLVFVILYLFTSSAFRYRRDGIPVVNRTCLFEPDIFARLRWAFNAKGILDYGHKKFMGQVYRLARGDVDILVLPQKYITELNQLPAGTLESRSYHAWSMLGHLTGMNVVRQTGHHVKVLLSRTSPALSELFRPIMRRIFGALNRLFPQNTETWTEMETLEPVVHIVSEGMALVLFGPPICDEPELVRLCFEHTRNMFAIVFIMRCVPAFLQRLLVWLLPVKWRLAYGWRRLFALTVPEIQHRRNKDLTTEESEASFDLLSRMVRDGEAAKIRDPHLLTELAGSVAVGGTYSTGNFVCRCISDLTAHQDALVAIRAEITAKHLELGGRPWNLTDVESLDKLESAMKETIRLSQGAVITYSRVVEREVVLSDGVRLAPGQFMTISAYNHNTDAAVFTDPMEYKAFRYLEGSPDAERIGTVKTKPFRVVDNNVLGWGAGRWACPGRFVASIVAKTILIKMLDEYDFEFCGGKEPPLTLIHEFGFWHPSNKMMVRKRKECLGIAC